MDTPNTSIQRPSKWQLATIAAIGFAIIWNFWTNWFPPTGVSIAKLSNTVFANVKIIPANYTFSIWGLIYIGLVAFSFYQLDSRRADNLALQQTRPWIVLASLLQSAWILLFLYQQMILSSLVMLGIVWALIKCYRNLHSSQPNIRQLHPNWVSNVFSIYLGWISVATIVNIASTLDSFGWQGSPLSPTLWTLLMIAISVGLALILLRVYADSPEERLRQRAFSGVIMWAIGGITIANLNDPAIALGGLLAIAILAICIIVRRG
jgi:hypothetical protein